MGCAYFYFEKHVFAVHPNDHLYSGIWTLVQANPLRNWLHQVFIVYSTEALYVMMRYYRSTATSLEIKHFCQKKYEIEHWCHCPLYEVFSLSIVASIFSFWDWAVKCIYIVSSKWEMQPMASYTDWLISSGYQKIFLIFGHFPNKGGGRGLPMPEFVCILLTK